MDTAMNGRRSKDGCQPTTKLPWPAAHWVRKCWSETMLYALSLRIGKKNKWMASLQTYNVLLNLRLRPNNRRWYTRLINWNNCDVWSNFLRTKTPTKTCSTTWFKVTLRTRQRSSKSWRLCMNLVPLIFKWLRVLSNDFPKNMIRKCRWRFPCKTGVVFVPPVVSIG